MLKDFLFANCGSAAKNSANWIRKFSIAWHCFRAAIRQFADRQSSRTAEIVANKIDKYNNNLTPPPSPSVKRSSHLWRDMMGVLRRKDSTAASSSVALANALNNNRISCPTGGSRSPSISILRHHRYYYTEVGRNWLFIGLGGPYEA